MNLLLRNILCTVFATVVMAHSGWGQNAILVNFGSNTCANSLEPSLSMIKNPLSGTPVVLASCSAKAQFPDFYSVFVAYNPKDNKVYLCDNRSGVLSNIWRLDMGLPQKIECPASISTSPDYQFTYVSNNFEFDNDGNLWSLTAYNGTTGQCQMDRFDLNTGTIISSKILQFPVGNFPTTISSGDLTILPNGRMFATLGITPSRLYEITNYNTPGGNANATFLQALPKDCFGIAYLNGELEITGTDLFTNCYYYRYSISGNSLSAEQAFQNGLAPIDNTSITPALGTTKQLLNATLVNSTTADLTYEVYVANMGNVMLNDINVVDDLGAAFGAANVSNVSVSFASNAPGLTLNPLYNGTSVTAMLNSGQNLANHTGSNNNYFFKLQVQCRVSNLVSSTTYLNSAVSQATIINAQTPVNVSDSSNNGNETRVDPDNDGNASGAGENEPTPFSINLLPVKFLGVNAWRDQGNGLLEWSIATPVSNASHFTPQYSADGSAWKSLPAIAIKNPLQSSYRALQKDIAAEAIFYRVQQTDLDGQSIMSKTVMLPALKGKPVFAAYPNPANDAILVQSANAGVYVKGSADLMDINGRVLLSAMPGAGGQIRFNTSGLANGWYVVRLVHSNGTELLRVHVLHP